jgi:hypothetical protein
MGYHEVPDISKARIAQSHQIADKSHSPIIPPNSVSVPSEKKNDTTSVSQDGGGKDFISNDVKFITAVVFGFAIIIILVVLVPRVGVHRHLHVFNQFLKIYLLVEN